MLIYWQQFTDSTKPMNQDQNRLTEDSNSSIGQTIICALLITMTLLINAFLSIGGLVYLICGGIAIYVTLTTILFNKSIVPNRKILNFYPTKKPVRKRRIWTTCITDIWNCAWSIHIFLNYVIWLIKIFNRNYLNYSSSLVPLKRLGHQLLFNWHSSLISIITPLRSFI